MRIDLEGLDGVGVSWGEVVDCALFCPEVERILNPLGLDALGAWVLGGVLGGVAVSADELGLGAGALACASLGLVSFGIKSASFTRLSCLSSFACWVFMSDWIFRRFCTISFLWLARSSATLWELMPRIFARNWLASLRLAGLACTVSLRSFWIGAMVLGCLSVLCLRLYFSMVSWIRLSLSRRL